MHIPFPWRPSARRFLQKISTERLHNLGDTLGEDYQGIWSPGYTESEVERSAHGAFRANAHVYAQKNPSNIKRAKSIGNVLRKSHIETSSVHNVLEIGAGHGNGIDALRILFPQSHIIATDITVEMLYILRHVWKDDPRVYPVQSDAEVLAFRDASMDFILGWGVLHHLFRPDLALKRCKEILKPGGAALFVEPLREGHEAHAMLYRDLLCDERSADFPPLLQRHFQVYILQSHYWFLPEKTLPIFGCMDDKWMFETEYFERTSAALQFHSCEILSVYRPSLEDLGLLGFPIDALPAWAWEKIHTADAHTNTKSAISAFILLRNPPH
jgi:ubiquinone/menaquinone biosynthesis C-methylase UbiE